MLKLKPQPREQELTLFCPYSTRICCLYVAAAVAVQKNRNIIFKPRYSRCVMVVSNLRYVARVSTILLLHILTCECTNVDSVSGKTNSGLLYECLTQTVLS